MYCLYVSHVSQITLKSTLIIITHEAAVIIAQEKGKVFFADKGTNGRRREDISVFASISYHICIDEQKS